MKDFLRALVLLMAIASAAPGAERTTPADFVGSWQGALVVGAQRLRLGIDVQAAEAGELRASVESPDQGASGIPVERVEVEGDSIRLEIRVLAAVFEGRLVVETQTIEGEWRQSGRVLPLDMKRAEVAAEGR